MKQPYRRRDTGVVARIEAWTAQERAKGRPEDECNWSNFVAETDEFTKYPPSPPDEQAERLAWAELEAALLAMAEALDWPAGVTAGEGDDLIVVAGGEGGEAAWHEWVAADSRADVELGMIRGVLETVIEMIQAGADPGPPDTWGDHHIRALEESWLEFTRTLPRRVL